MYRVSKVLNNNGLIAIDMEDNQEYVLLGKGIGFGKKISQRFEKPENCTLYSLKTDTERGNAGALARTVAPEYLEIADEILGEAEKAFGTIDRRILFTMADHIAFAVDRIRGHEQISNPLTDDIKALFYSEYKVASSLRDILMKRMNVPIDDDEIGYVALHVHSAIMDERVSVAMQMAGVIRECINLIEKETGKKIDVMSLSYNRLMNHIRYMVARIKKGERLKLDMNDYMEIKYPKAFRMATTVCDQLSESLQIRIDEMEIGYLAMHIARVRSDEEDNMQ